MWKTRFATISCNYVMRFVGTSYDCALQDMAAHSACDFGGGKAERLALAKYRSVVWQGRVSNARLSDKELRDKGKCPMTPEEVGIMLAALGFSPETHVYLASYTVSIRPT